MSAAETARRDPPLIVVGTGNEKKLDELIRLVPNTVARFVPVSEYAPDLEAPEETGSTFEENARLKAEYYATHCGTLALADDSGLEVDALGGRPGVHSARFAGPDATDAANNAKLVRELAGIEDDDRTARFVCVIALASPGAAHVVVRGECNGLIVDDARGAGGFGYDPHFFVPEIGKTFAELTREEKSRISHRGRALAEFSRLLPAALHVIENRRNY